MSGHPGRSILHASTMLNTTKLISDEYSASRQFAACHDPTKNRYHFSAFCGSTTIQSQ